MKALVVYDSNFGNTKLVAEAISREFTADILCIRATEFSKTDLNECELFIVGSPIIGWNPSPNTIKLLDSLDKDSLKGKQAAAFDTRVKMWISGNAARKIAKRLKNSGAKLLADPIGFYVKGKEGPLFEGELQRAEEWARSIKSGL